MRRNKPKTLEDFAAFHLEQEQRLVAYSLSRGRGPHTQQIIDNAKLFNAGSLLATHREVRQEYAKACFAALEDLVQAHPRQNFWFVTLSPSVFAMPWEQAEAFDHRRLIRWAQRQLKGLRYIAIVEAGLYTAGPRISHSRYGWVSFHVHAQVWGCSEDRVRGLVESLNERYTPLFPGPTAAHFRKITPKKVAGHWLYPMKFPADDYRAYPKKKTVRDPHTGEVRPILTGYWQQKTRPIGSGQLVRMHQVLAHRTLPSMMFAGQAGKRLLKAIKERVAKELTAAADDSRKGLDAQWVAAGLASPVAPQPQPQSLPPRPSTHVDLWANLRRKGASTALRTSPIHTPASRRLLALQRAALAKSKGQ